MDKAEKVDGLPFKWGKKSGGTSVEMKDVQFYESFTYGGCEYCLYDCVSVGDSSKLDSSDFFVGKIIKMWAYNDQRQNPRRVELLWFFKPCELSLYLDGVQDVLANELFLASGSGVGLTNENPLEAISGKCHVICISKDIRNPQPSDEEIKSADFVFHRTYDVGTSKILDKIDDTIAGVDVKFIFNRASCERKASVVQKVATDVQGTADSLKPNFPSTSGSVRQNERNVSDFSGNSKSEYGYKNEQDNESHKQLARKKSTLAEERSNKNSGRRDDELDSFSASGSRRNDCHGRKDQDDEVEKQLAKQKPRVAEERCSRDSYSLDDMRQLKQRLDGTVAVSDVRTKESQNIIHDGRKDIKPVRKAVMVEKSNVADKRCSKDSYYLDDMLQKKRMQDGSIAVSDERMKETQKIRNDGRKYIEPIRRDAMVEKSRLAEERRSLDGLPQKKRRLDSSVSDGRTRESHNISHDGRKGIQCLSKDVMVEKSRLAGDYMPQKKLALNGSAAVSDGRKTMSQKISHDERKDPRDKVARGEVYSQTPSFSDKNQDLRIPRFSEGKETRPAIFSEAKETRPARLSEGKETRHVRFYEGKETRPARFSEGNETRPATVKGILKKSSPDCKISKHTEEKMLTNADYRRHYQAFEVTQKPNVEGSKWFRKLTWEENLRCAEGKGTLVLLRNLDPSYTSDEVENIVYSALNEQCTARMIERTSATIPHIGEALVIFETTDAAKRAIRRLDEGCLLLSNGRILVATSAKVNPPAMSSSRFTGHINPRELCRWKRSAAVTSHCAQGNTIEFEMAMDWCLHQEEFELAWKRLYERQMEENTRLQLDVKPNDA